MAQAKCLCGSVLERLWIRRVEVWVDSAFKAGLTCAVFPVLVLSHVWVAADCHITAIPHHFRIRTLSLGIDAIRAEGCAELEGKVVSYLVAVWNTCLRVG